MYYYKYESLVGVLYIVSDDEHLLSIQIERPEEGRSFESEIIKDTMSQLDEYFNGKRKIFNLPLNILGTDFEKEVYNHMINVPYGHTVSYKQLSETSGRAKAYRAVGSVCAKNPYPIVVPCHRILKSDQTLGGYALGLEMKVKLLELEGKTIINGKVS